MDCVQVLELEGYAKPWANHIVWLPRARATLGETLTQEKNKRNTHVFTIHITFIHYLEKNTQGCANRSWDSSYRNYWIVHNQYLYYDNDLP